MAALPKRESSRRKAKDNSSTKMKMLAGGLGAGGSDEEDEKDIDLSDSDQDESWTPFKEKDSKEKGGKGSDDKKQSNGPRYRQVASTLLFDSFNPKFNYAVLVGGNIFLQCFGLVFHNLGQNVLNFKKK